MNRFKQAWLALTGRLEPEVREVEVGVEKVSLYKITGNAAIYGIDSLYGRHFLTCGDAFDAMGANRYEVEKVAAIRVGGRYFHEWQIIPHKPKVAKGKRRG